MNIKITEINNKLTERCANSIEYLKNEFGLLRVGKANAKVLDKVTVDNWGTSSPINQVANISSPDPRTLAISAWDKSMLGKIEKAIIAANIGLTPTNDGTVIRLVFPIVTEEQRKDLVKKVKKYSEEVKVEIRNHRRDAMDALKKMKTDKEISEDEFSIEEKELDKIVQKNIEVVEKLEKEKEKEILTI